MLAERSGIPMPKRSEYADADTKLRAAIFRCMRSPRRHSATVCKAPAGAEARAYLDGAASRRSRSSNLVSATRNAAAMLYCSLFESRALPRPARAVRAGAQAERGAVFDRFRNRLMFPIHNESGKIIAFRRVARSAKRPTEVSQFPRNAHLQKELRALQSPSRQGRRSEGGADAAGRRVHGRDRRLCRGGAGSGGELRHGADQSSGAVDQAARRPHRGQFRSRRCGSQRHGAIDSAPAGARVCTSGCSSSAEISIRTNIARSMAPTAIEPPWTARRAISTGLPTAPARVSNAHCRGTRGRLPISAARDPARLTIR